MAKQEVHLGGSVPTRAFASDALEERTEHRQRMAKTKHVELDGGHDEEFRLRMQSAWKWSCGKAP